MSFELLEIRHPGVQKCIVHVYASHLNLITLRIEDERQCQGIGSIVLKNLQAVGKTIYLIPAARDYWRQDDLERFYSRHGFVTDFFDPDLLVWKPTPFKGSRKRPLDADLPGR